MIGPQIPPHLLNRHDDDDDDDEQQGPPPIGPQIPLTADDDDDDDKGGPRSIGPQIPLTTTTTTDDDDDDQGPPPPSTSKRILGPSLPPTAPTDAHHPHYDDNSDSDDDSDIGPKPLPSHFSSYTSDGVREFLEREDRRRQLAEDAAKPQTLKRQEWMLAPPSSSGVLGCTSPLPLPLLLTTITQPLTAPSPRHQTKATPLCPHIHPQSAGRRHALDRDPRRAPTAARG